MLCKKPYMIGSMPCACGQCLPCRINRRRVWTHRMMLESYKHGDSSFVTLTYDEEHVPSGSTLVPGHATGWIKRLRKVLEPQKIRYFLVGEYGDESQRPHYHVAVFGLNRYVGGGFDGCSGIVRETWPFGFVYVGALTRESAQYVAGYVTKKMTSKDDARLKGRYPEFARMSLRPGIGAGVIDDLAGLLESPVGLRCIEHVGDVPGTLRHGSRSLPLGRYLRGKLRQKFGLDRQEAKDDRCRRAVGEMQELRRGYEVMASLVSAEKTGQQIMLDERAQKLRNLDCRFKIFESRKTI